MYEPNEAMEGASVLDLPTPEAEAPTQDQKGQDPYPSDTDGDVGGDTEEAGGEAAQELPDPEADPEAPAQSSDPAPEALEADPKPDSELEQLRRELKELRGEMEAQRRAYDRMGEECAEFCELYPEKSPSELPDEVFASMRRGIPLAAAYALYERRRARLEEAAKLLNTENRERSAGGVESAKGGYLSPDEVRAMTPAEVRANYQSILLSMKTWR